MKITLNNRPEIFEAESLSVAEIIGLKNFTFKLLVTKLNGRLVKKEDRTEIMVKEGDSLLILHQISGG